MLIPGPLTRSSAAPILMLAAVLFGGVTREATAQPLGVVIITVDALRADRLSSYGYQRPTSPNIDRLLAGGARFTRAWTVEPLTNPALTSMLTGLPPHHHGATRNGLRMKTGLVSLPMVLRADGWRTAAFVSNWTLRDKISRLAEHFDHYQEVFTRKRWFGLVNGEATAEDVTDQAIDWLDDHCDDHPQKPFFLWLHYVEPHAPYRFHAKQAEALGIGRQTTRSDSYDTEIRVADLEIGRFLDRLYELAAKEQVLIAFAADHGESLGEHGYWGHGRHLYEPSLRIPMGLSWPGRVPSGTFTDAATIIDLAPTILELLGRPVPPNFAGVSWADALCGGTQPQTASRCYQAHRGAVQIRHESQRARTRGLMEVGVIGGDVKQILRVRKNRLWEFDLTADPEELQNLVARGQEPDPDLVRCLGEVTTGLDSLDHLTVPDLDDESIEQLKALGYLHD